MADEYFLGEKVHRTQMEFDVAKLVAESVVPRLEEKINDVYREVVNLFKQGKLTPEKVTGLTADMFAIRRLLTWVETQAGGK